MDLNQVYDKAGVTTKGGKEIMGYIFIGLALFGGYALVRTLKTSNTLKRSLKK